MPRKRRSSAKCAVTNKSPRKLNLNASSESDSTVDNEISQIENISLTIDGLEVVWAAQEEIACLSGEESENENKKPIEKEEDGNSIPAASCLSPLKRASPLSPTLLDNVVQKQLRSLVASPSVESDPAVTPTPITKPEPESGQPLKSTVGTRSSTRRHIVNETINQTKLFGENETPIVSEDSGSLPRTKDKKDEETTTASQKPSEACNRVNLPVANYRILDNYSTEEVPPPDPLNYRKVTVKSKEELCREILYELDEVDISWLNTVNKLRTERHDGLNLGNVEYEEMELLLDRFEKENYFELQNSGMGQPGESDEDAVCCICLDGESDNSNQIIFCDMCNIPVHQDCFGVPFIPEGSWLCRRCSISPNADIECIFCPNKYGAFKQTVDGRWSHVLCALWIPEVRFANPTLIEPVDDIDDIPPARWKLTCFLCKQKGVGACIQCHLRSCVTAFHATCAQAAGLSLKFETKESVGVRLTASCDKHTSPRDMDILKQKIQTINKVLDEAAVKRATPQEMQYPVISANRIAAICELVTFPGRYVFVRRLLAFWKLKRKNRGGAPLLRNLELLWNSGMTEPPAPPKIERQNDPVPVELCFEKMQALKGNLSVLKKYCELVKSRCELEREDQNLKFKIESIKLDSYSFHGIHKYLDILNKLSEKDKYDTFAQPVTCDEAPEYFDIISNPMDLSTMRKKVLQLEYSTLDDLEADFNLMINNCMTYNKKSTEYYKDAVKLKEYGSKIFQEEKRSLEENDGIERKLDAIAVEAQYCAEYKNELMDSVDLKDLKYNPLQGVLISILEELIQHDKNDIFAEPVDVKLLPDYFTVIEKPMDFSTMRSKINTNQYSCIEELEADYFLMINNCLQYNDEKTVYYKVAQKLNTLGRNIFEEAKHKHYMPGFTPFSPQSTIAETNNNNCKSVVSNSVIDNSAEVKELSEEEVRQIMSDVLMELNSKDVEQIFTEPVTDDVAPGYSDVIKTPMDLSLIGKKIKSSSYISLEDMEKDFTLMIDNCKKFNTPGTLYHNYAKRMKREGNSIFNAARKRLGPVALHKNL